MLKKIIKYILNERYKLRFVNKNIRFLPNVKIDNQCKFEGHNSIGENNILTNIYLGKGSYTGKNVILNSILIGKFCSIGSFVRNTVGRHPTSTFVTTHPAFFSKGNAAGFTFSNEQKFKELEYVEDNFLVKIENDVWIGDNVTILDGITIGNGAIIGSGSLITKNIEPYSINVGVPAKIIKYRFEPDIINFLQNYRWWDREMSWLEKEYRYFENIKIFRQKYEEN